MNKFFFFLLGFTTLVSTINPVSASTINVPGGKPTIQAGIDAASPGDTVLVQPGRYIETIDFKGKDIVVGSLFLATKDTTYISNTIIDGNKDGSVITFKNGETEKAELCGVTVTGGDTLYDKNQLPFLVVLSWGGGIYCKNASPYLHHLIVEGNLTDYDGGGIHLEKSNSVIEYCVIRNNRAVMSGGGFYLLQGNNKINNLTINNNKAVWGDGISCITNQNNMQIDHVLFYNNYNSVYFANSYVDITNCTIFDLRSGHAISSESSSINIINTTIWTEGKWEIYSYVDPQYPGSIITVSHSDIKNGISSVGKGVQDSLYWLDGNISIDPFFVDEIQNNYSLQKGSPCIDGGTSFFSIGNRTIVDIKKELYNGINPDIGCFESDYTSSIVNENPTYNMYLSNFPNPFNSTTTIHYSLSKPGHVHLAVYSITGQKVIDLLDKSLPVGNYQTQWNGIDKSGNKVSSGLYIVQLNTGIRSISNRVVYMK